VWLERGLLKDEAHSSIVHPESRYGGFADSAGRGRIRLRETDGRDCASVLAVRYCVRANAPSRG
jgi:hypothetical protein